MEPFIALLLTVVFACLMGFRLGHRKTLKAQDSESLATTYGEYLRAVSAAGLVRLSNVTGDAPDLEDIQQSINGSRLISDMLELLEGEHGDAVITDMREGNPETVGALLMRLSDDAEKYWPERIADLERARESLA